MALLTNFDVTALDQAEESLSGYHCRWQVEIFFRVLKFGCKIEALQLEKIDRLDPTIMLNRMIRMITGFGGFLNRTGDALPGPKTIWIGLHRAKNLALATKSLLSVGKPVFGYRCA